MWCANCGEWNICVCGSIWTVWHLITRERERIVWKLTTVTSLGAVCAVYPDCTQILLKGLELDTRNRIKQILEKCKPFYPWPTITLWQRVRGCNYDTITNNTAVTGGCWPPLTAMTNHIKHPAILNHNNNWCNGSHKHNHHYKDSFYLYLDTFWCWEGREQTSLWPRVATKIGTMTGDISFDE